MIGLIVLIVGFSYLGLLIWATRSGWNWGQEKGWHGNKRYLGSVIGFSIIALPVFWDWIPTVVMHDYYCSTEAGLTIYKTLEQWKLENPGTTEFLIESNDELRSYSESYNDGHGKKFTKYLNNRFISIMALEDVSNILFVSRQERYIQDVNDNSILARYVDYSRGGSIKIESDTGMPDTWKLWLRKSTCFLGARMGVLGKPAITPYGEYAEFSKQIASLNKEVVDQLVWDKKEIIGEDHINYLEVNLNNEKLRVSKDYVRENPPARPTFEIVVLWPGLEPNKKLNRQSTYDFDTIRILFRSTKVRTPFSDTYLLLERYKKSSIMSNPVQNSEKPELRKYKYGTSEVYYEITTEDVKTPNGHPLVTRCSWKREEGDRSTVCKVEMTWSNEISIQYEFRNYEMVFDLPQIQMGITSLLQSFEMKD